MMGKNAELFAALHAGDRAALGRAITLVESEREEDRPSAHELIAKSSAVQAHSLRLGVTGIPGVGKSTLIDALGNLMIEQGHRVAVLAIDPSSARSGGSILGDKTRMTRLALSDKAFIRPTATGGKLGGIARRTREAMLLCEAAGYDRIIIETVGAGQNELEVDDLCDVNVLLMIAGAGDDLQGIKRGIMESADVIVFTKAEGDALARTRAAILELQGAIALLSPRPSGRRPEVHSTSAVAGTGITALNDLLERLHREDLDTGYAAQRRKEQALRWLEQAMEQQLLKALMGNARVAQRISSSRESVANGKSDAFTAAEELIASLRKDGVLPP